MLVMQELTKSYSIGTMEVPVLQGITLQVMQGEFVAIMGPSGSGKSTLMNILGCLDRPSSGGYAIDKMEVSAMDDDDLAEMRSNKIGFVFQNFNLLPRISSLDNVALPMIYNQTPKAVRERIADKALAMVGLTERKHHRPNELSGGQRQRVAIARALVNSPALILADEPTGNLDSRSGEEIMEIFQQLNREKGCTIIVVTHELSIARHAGRILCCRDGRITEGISVTGRYEVRQELAAALTSGEGT